MSNGLIVLLLVTSCFVILMSCRRWIEALFLLVLILSTSFYYSENIQYFFVEMYDRNGREVFFVLQNIIVRYRQIVLSILDFEGIRFFGKTIFLVRPHDFSPRIWPMIIIGFGICMRWFISGFVRSHKLKEIGREYWLMITAYLVLVFIFADVTSRNFISTFFFLTISIAVVAVGLFRVGSDVLGGLWNLISSMYHLIKIFVLYVVFVGVNIARHLSNLFKSIKDLYEKYILRPFRRVYKVLQEQLVRLELDVNSKLNRDVIECSKCGKITDKYHYCSVCATSYCARHYKKGTCPAGHAA